MEQFLRIIIDSDIFVYTVMAALPLLWILPYALFAVWLERKVSAHMQDRLGPMRVGGWHGWAQTIADILKLIQKEDIVPAAADKQLHFLAPFVVFVGSYAAYAAIPFSSAYVGSGINIGLFYIIAVSALVTVGILMAGWSSNNKWSLLGGIRSAAQIVSYEIPAGLSIFPIVMLSGALSMQSIIAEQGAAPWRWFIFNNPFTFIAFFIFFVAALAEGNRTPFDLPEAESELVMGFATEYSGMRNLLFFMAEWGNLYVIGAIVATLFLGGWQIPWALAEHPVPRVALQFATFFLKAYFWVFVAVWLRWTLPRIRVDQMMIMCWKYLVPLAFVNLLGTAAWMVVFPHGAPGVPQLLCVAAAVLLGLFLRRVRYHLKRAGLKREELSYNILATERIPGLG